MTKDGPEIPLLTSSNYWEWAIRVEDRLITKGLDDYIREGAVRNTEVQMNNDRKAMALIRTYVSLEMLPYIRGLTSARPAWVALAAQNAQTLQAKRLGLEEQLINLRMGKSEDVTEYCARARRVQLELTGAGDEVPDHRLARSILNGLPDEFEAVRNVLLLQAATEVNLDAILMHLKAAEERMNRATDQDAAALAAQNRQQKKAKKSSVKNIVCFKCGKPGHFKRDCPEGSRSTKTSRGVALTARSTANPAEDGHHTLQWVVDSGATDHIIADDRFCRDLKGSSKTIMMGNGVRVKAKAEGSVWMTTQVGSKEVFLKLDDVLVIPEAPHNLLSVSRMVDKGAKVVSEPGHTKIFMPGHGTVGDAVLDGGLPILMCSARPIRQSSSALVGKAMHARHQNPKAYLWHHRLGHVSFQTLSRMAKKQMVSGMDIEERGDSSEACETCIKAKQVSQPYPISKSRARVPCELVHTDLMGPLKPMSAGGNQYVLTAIDDFSGYAEVKPLKRKSEASEELKGILLRWERRLGTSVRTVRSDQGTEYADFNKFCQSVGISREYSVAYSPAQNGRAERFNRTLTEKTRAMFLSSGIPKKYWGDAFATAAKVYNLCPSAKGDVTPFELFFQKKPDVSRIRVFGCVVYCMLEKMERSKLDSRSEKGRLLGYEDGIKGWKVLLDSGKVVVRRNCRFDESNVMHSTAQSYVRYEDSDSDKSTDDESMHGDGGAGNEDDTASEADTVPEDSGGAGGDTDVDMADERHNAPNAPSKRTTAEPKLTRAAAKKARHALVATGANLPETPASYSEMIQRPDREQWEPACDEEINALQELNVFEVVDKPAGVQPLTGKWVFELKCDKEGNITRYRARLVVRGHKQRSGIDYNEVFSPVAKAETIRMMLAYAAAHDLQIEQIDVRTAFLYGDLHENIYMEPPEGYDFGGEKVWKLNKSLYGLKQAARAWHETLRTVLTEAGFAVSTADTSLFLCSKHKTTTYLLIYVDDGLIVGHKEQVQEVVDVLEKRFKLRKMGQVEYFLGSEVIRDWDTRTIVVTQRKYAQKIVDVAGQADAKPRSIPLDANARVSRHGDDVLKDSSKYAEITGMLMYLANGTRPDLSFSVGLLARFMASPRQEHWRRLIGVVRYLKKTVNYGIKFDGKRLGDLTGYCDADFGGDPDKRRSTTGYLFLLAGGAVSWASKLQPTVAASTTEAEYMAAAHAAKEALWLKKLMGSFGQGSKGIPILMYNDNQAAQAIMKNPTSHQKAKHIDIHHHFVRDRVQRGEVVVEHVESKLNCADMLTKAVSKVQLENLSSSVGLVDLAKV